MDIAQNRLAQDGRFDLGLGNQAFDVRVSVLPSSAGEKAVLRLLAKGPMAMDFEKLGIIGRNRDILEDMAKRPFGMILITGPTGSGKTTSLYACLAKIDCVAKNVVTVEDPIEYQFPRITQLQVHPKIGMTFAHSLRAILRQDPDVIMVGEIRDLETLQIAMQAALTGHTVFSTLHCNDAAGGAARMVDMGAESFLITSSVNAIVAQRLVRVICNHCKVEAEVSPAIRTKLGLVDDPTPFYTGRGCAHCRNSGYSGRIGVFEVIPMIDPIQETIMKSPNATTIRSVIREHQLPTLLEDAMDKARRGWISLDEVVRAVLVDAI
jgi:general secretion pathway protein E